MKENNKKTSSMHSNSLTVDCNEQGGNKCKVCGHLLYGEPFKVCLVCEDDDHLW
jgi:rubrerythrin